MWSKSEVGGTGGALMSGVVSRDTVRRRNGRKDTEKKKGSMGNEQRKEGVFE